MQPSVFVPLLIVGILLFQAILWTLIISAMRRRRAKFRAALEAALAEGAARGERLVCGPMFLRVRTAHLSFGTMGALTNERLLLGTDSFALSDVRSVRTDRSYFGAIRAGCTWVILQLPNEERGLAIRSDVHQSWVNGLKRA